MLKRHRQRLQNSMDGYKTYAFLAVTLLGFIGIQSDVIDQNQISEVIAGFASLIGIIGAAYGRWDASRRSKKGEEV